MPVFDNAFYEITALLLVAAVVDALALRLRQPLIVVFIAVGIAAGPAGLDWVRSHDQVDLFAAVGALLLLFVVGLRPDLNLTRNLGPVARATGLGQSASTPVVGDFIAIALATPFWQEHSA